MLLANSWRPLQTNPFLSELEPLPHSLGFGLGLRPQHYVDLQNGSPHVDWLEIITENYMVPGGKPLAMLERIREHFPLVMHGVSMSIASTSPLNLAYLHEVKRLAERIEPKWVSDHLCWTGVHGVNLHDLLPVPYTEEALQHVVERVNMVQDILERPLTLENVSSYASFRQSEMNEWEFLRELTQRTGCWLLLDINNLYVNSRNHGVDAVEFINGIPRASVVQFHLAGHSDMGTFVIDTHDAPICEGVWDLYRIALERFGPVSTLIERDDNIPPFEELIDELEHARAVASHVRSRLMVAGG